MLHSDVMCDLLKFHVVRRRCRDDEHLQRLSKRLCFLDLAPEVGFGQCGIIVTVAPLALNAGQPAVIPVFAIDIDARLRLACSAMQLGTWITPDPAEQIETQALECLPVGRRREWRLRTDNRG